MHNRKISGYISLQFSVVLILALYSCSSNQNITVKELREDIMYLSSDSLKGRLTGSPGDSLAAEYIRSKLTSSGLKPLTGDGFQRFRVISRLVPGKNNTLSIRGKDFVALSEEKDFMPLAFSSNSGFESEVIFAGYGFNINTDSLKWNDYKDIDVKGKWVLILRADPETDKQTSPFIPFSSDRDKALMARDMGAAGVLLVSGPVYDQQDTFESLNTEDYSVNMPALRIKRNVADFILGKSKKTVACLEEKLNQTRKPSSFNTGTVVRANAEIIREMSTTRNVAMILPGEDSNLRNEYLIIGAHFDHLGMGGPNSRAGDTVAVHHGADDNASGVSLMLELAKKFAHSGNSHKRSIICVAFTGEEEGLLGSKHFVENPGIDLSKVEVMINLDMVGRLQEAGKLQISGVGTAEDLKKMVTSVCDTSVIKLALSDEGYGPSDHSSFYGKNIPVLFFTTGAHIDYHTPSDTWDKINYEGMVKISSLIFNVGKEFSTINDRLKFREAGPKVEQGRYMRRKMVTLGIMPDFAGNVKNGLRADNVDPGKPAALGGMKKGDIITSINGKSVNNIYDYMFRMGQLKHGQTISVEILRDNKKMVLLIQL